MDLTKVLVGAFVAGTSLFGLVFVGGFFLLAFPVDPLRVGSAMLTEFDVPLVVAVVAAVVFLIPVVAPVLLGLGFVVKGVTE
jgi:hypothetical protein